VTDDPTGDERPRVSVERDGHVLVIGLDRPEKRNAADLRMLRELSLAYGLLDRDPELRVGLLIGHGEHFTAGLDLADVAPAVGDDGLDVVPESGLHPWQVEGRQPHRGTAEGQDGPAHLDLAETGAGLGDHDVARQGELDAERQAGALDRRHDGLRQLPPLDLPRVQPALGHDVEAVVAHGGRDVGEVEPGGEVLAVPDQQADAEVGVAVEEPVGERELAQHP
jgi:hypothetical protein